MCQGLIFLRFLTEKGFIMRRTRNQGSVLKTAFLFASVVVVLAVGVVGQFAAILLSRLKRTPLLQSDFEIIKREFGSFSKPALY
jgi:hypothetical protein